MARDVVEPKVPNRGIEPNQDSDPIRQLAGCLDETEMHSSDVLGLILDVSPKCVSSRSRCPSMAVCILFLEKAARKGARIRAENDLPPNIAIKPSDVCVRADTMYKKQPVRI